jgi:molybdopterin-guanine dinucleotide biosynthesis protein A
VEPIDDHGCAIQPVVLVGGRSRRFGRDKLREPVGGGWLVDRPITALREVFGPRVGVVGPCDPAVAARADLVIPDRYPGIGPTGGILSALEETGGDIFVLAGDLPRITAEAVQLIVKRGAEGPGAWAVLADSGRLEPCIGLYRASCLGPLRERIGDGQAARLWDLVPAEHLIRVAIPAALAANVNTPDNLDRTRGEITASDGSESGVGHGRSAR